MKNSNKELERIASLLREQSTLALATQDEDGQVCIAPLFYICDDDLSLYWLSDESSQHSRNLRRSGGAAITIHTQTASWKAIRGVQMRGSVTAVSDPNGRQSMIKAYCKRFELSSVFRVAISRSTLFVFRPTFIRYIDNSLRFGERIELGCGVIDAWSVIDG